MEDKSLQVLVPAIVFLILTWLFVGTRTYIRARMLKAMGLDDWVMIGALLAFTGYLSCQIGGVAHGTGRHIEDISEENAQKALRFWFFCEVFYAPSTTLLKVSVGLFLLRIAIHKIQVWIIRIFIAGSIVFGTFYFFLTIFQCNPVSFWWDLNPDHHGTCISATAFAVCGYIVSALNSAADLTFAILPMIIVWNTTMNSTTRALVCILLGLASIAGIVTLIRFPYIHTLDKYKGDFLWNTTEVAILTTLEVGLGITAGCAATFRPLLRQWLGGTNKATAYQTTPNFNKHSMPKMGTPIVRHSQKNGSFLGQSKATVVTTITGRESWSHMPDLVLLESQVPLEVNHYIDSEGK